MRSSSPSCASSASKEAQTGISSLDPPQPVLLRYSHLPLPLSHVGNVHKGLKVKGVESGIWGSPFALRACLLLGSLVLLRAQFLFVGPLPVLSMRLVRSIRRSTTWRSAGQF